MAGAVVVLHIGCSNQAGF